MEIKMTIPDEKVEELVHDIMENYPEASSGPLECVDWDYDRVRYIFNEYEDETPTRHTVTKEMLVRGFEILIGLIQEGKYHNGGLRLNDYLEDVGNWDAFDADALVQCALFGEIIYG